MAQQRSAERTEERAELSSDVIWPLVGSDVVTASEHRPALQVGSLFCFAARHVHRSLGRDITAAIELFTEDAELVIPQPPVSFTPYEAFKGRDAIAEALSRVLRLDGTVHEIVGHIIDPVDHDRAHGRTACVAHHFIRGKDDEWHIHYDDTYVRTSAGWRIARRAYTVDSMRVSELRYPQQRD